ncbi:hypothetical protein [Streptomyces sp. 8N706]|uniref:hypothetical protein n=1 Tax=Streptomyces sp. 8N706 TaxID=3457416 RepID=UPI003FD04583
MATLLLAPTAMATQPSRSARVEVPARVTAGVAVFDRRTGTFTERINAESQFRSASVVKLLIALDYLWNRGPAYDVPPADRRRLESMLRSSDDSSASQFWAADGRAGIVRRMVSRLSLTGTAGPPPGYPGYWGYTALTASDTVKVYRYILDSAPAAVRDFVMGNLRASTRCAADGFDQHFGIPSAFRRPWAVKQGWSGFGSGGGCIPHATTGDSVPAAPENSRGGATPDAVDLDREALHTTGTVGTDDRAIVAAFTLQPDGTSYGKACARLSALTRSLRVPGAVRRAETRPVRADRWREGDRAGSARSASVRFGSGEVRTRGQRADARARRTWATR